MTPAQRLLWVLVAVLFLTVAAVAWRRVAPMLNPEVALVASVVEGCDLRAGPCKATFPDGSEVVFEIRPHRIPVAQPLLIEVETRGIAARRVEVDFAGADMNMGFNRVTLRPRAADGTGEDPIAGAAGPKAAARTGADPSEGRPKEVAADPPPHGFAGTGMLPVCVRARMTWEARVLLHTERGLLAAPFRFDTFLAYGEPSR